MQLLNIPHTFSIAANSAPIAAERCVAVVIFVIAIVLVVNNIK